MAEIDKQALIQDIKSCSFTRQEILEKYNIPVHTFYTFKKTHNLTDYPSKRKIESNTRPSKWRELYDNKDYKEPEITETTLENRLKNINREELLRDIRNKMSYPNLKEKYGLTAYCIKEFKRSQGLIRSRKVNKKVNEISESSSD